MPTTHVTGYQKRAVIAGNTITFLERFTPAPASLLSSFPDAAYRCFAPVHDYDMLTKTISPHDTFFSCHQPQRVSIFSSRTHSAHAFSSKCAAIRFSFISASACSYVKAKSPMSSNIAVSRRLMAVALVSPRRRRTPRQPRWS